MNNTTNTNNINQNIANQINIDSLKIASINVNSIVSFNKRYDLYTFAKTHNLDVILVCETKLNARHKLQFADFNIIRTDRSPNSKGGGTATLIKNTIQHEIVYSSSSKNNEIIEYSIISIKLDTKKLFLIAIYANNVEKKKFISEIDSLFSRFNLSDVNNLHNRGRFQRASHCMG